MSAAESLMPDRYRLRMCRGLGHIGVLAGAACHSSGRRTVAAMWRALQGSAAAYRRGGLPACMAALDTAAGAWPGQIDGRRALAYADALAATLRARPFRYCMRRSLLRYLALRLRGLAPCFTIGVERSAGPSELEGHAWVELQGLPYREEDDRPVRLAIMFRYPVP